MPLDCRMIGASTDAVTHTVDARWIMAHAAGLGDLNPRYLDTAASGPIVAHPLFPVCLEWPAVLASRKLPGGDSLTPAEAARGVHAAHDLHIYRPIRADEVLSTQATVVSLEQIKPGAAQLTRLDTVDSDGKLVCRTYQLGISRGVSVTGTAAPLESAPAVPEPEPDLAEAERFSIPITGSAAHVYTECARIYNPIHTDRSVALAAGLPDIILHGTATLALAVSRLVDEYLGGDSGPIRRVGGRLTAMVRMPSTLTLEVQMQRDGTLFFSVLTDTGEPAFSRGYLCRV